MLAKGTEPIEGAEAELTSLLPEGGLLAIPLTAQGAPRGVLVVPGPAPADVLDGLAEALGEALMLGRTLSRLVSSEKQYRSLFDRAPAAVLALVITPLFRSLTERSFRSTFLLVFVCLLLHDVLDLLQATDRNFWWPLSHHAVGPGESLIPTYPMQEAALFGGAYLITVLAYRLWGSSDRLKNQTNADLAPRSTLLTWLNIVMTSVVLSPVLVGRRQESG